MDQQRSGASPGPEGRRPKRFLVTIEEEDLEAIRETFVQSFDLTVEALRTISADEE
jgi:hypothetical protein